MTARKLKPKPPSERPVSPRDLEVRTAALQRSIMLMEKLERMLTRIGGHMTYEDQQALRESREFLVDMGRRVDPLKFNVWTDRG